MDSPPPSGELGESEFEDLYRETAPAIRAYILHQCSDSDAADDLCQTTFVKFIEICRKRRRAIREPRAYLYRVAFSVVADHGRALQRERRFVAMSRHGRAQRPPEPHAERIAIRAALEALSDRERQLLWLLYAEGCKHKEAARIMNVGTASVRVMAFRARRKLLARLERAPGGGPAKRS